MHPASLQFLPSSHASSLSTMPVFSSATGLGCEYVHLEFEQPVEYRHNAFDVGFSGIGPGETLRLGGTTDTECLPSFVPGGIFAGLGRMTGALDTAAA